MDVVFMWSWADDTARGPEVGKDVVCRWNSEKSSRERVTGQCTDQVIKGPVSHPRCLSLVLRERSYFFSFTGGVETRMLHLGCVSGLVVKVAKLKRRSNYLKSWSSLLFVHWLLRERDTSGQRETDQLWAGLLGYWHFCPISFFITLLERGRTYTGGEEWVPVCSI